MLAQGAGGELITTSTERSSQTMYNFRLLMIMFVGCADWLADNLPIIGRCVPMLSFAFAASYLRQRRQPLEVLTDNTCAKLAGHPTSSAARMRVRLLAPCAPLGQTYLDMLLHRCM